MFLSIPPIKSNKEVLLASDMVRVKISSCVDEQKAVCELLTPVQGVSRSLRGPRVLYKELSSTHVQEGRRLCQ